jgi:NAD(P)-dependent dehydrogenase (short-subunit alcohol dehydrogenase family)
MYCMRVQLKRMEVNGSIVNVASVAGLMGRRQNATYAAGKHGVISLSRSAAKQPGSRAMRVNVFAP